MFLVKKYSRNTQFSARKSQFSLTQLYAVKKNTQMSFTSSLKREQDSLPQIKLRFKYLKKFQILRTSFLCQPFLTWLKANVGVARKRLTACEPVRLEIERLQVTFVVRKYLKACRQPPVQGSICYEYQLEDILWDCGWETAHRRGTVQAFKALVEGYPEVQPIVRGRTIVFGKDSGVALAGQIVLYSGEVISLERNSVTFLPGEKQLAECGQDCTQG